MLRIRKGDHIITVDKSRVFKYFPESMLARAIE